MERANRAEVTSSFARLLQGVPQLVYSLHCPAPATCFVGLPFVLQTHDVPVHSKEYVVPLHVWLHWQVVCPDEPLPPLHPSGVHGSPLSFDVPLSPGMPASVGGGASHEPGKPQIDLKSLQTDGPVQAIVPAPLVF